jgi:hypothetical protein
VNQFLEQENRIGKLVVKVAHEASNPSSTGDDEASHRPGYVLVLLGACMMSLGIELNTEFFSHLREIYTDPVKVGLMRDAMGQMEKALFGPSGYTAGTPYDVQSLGIEATTSAGPPPIKDMYHPLVFNVPSPSGIITAELVDVVMQAGGFEDREKLAQSMAKFHESRKGKGGLRFPLEACGGCGVERREGNQPLGSCTRCKAQKYCSVECQREDYRNHRGRCKIAEERGNEKGRKMARRRSKWKWWEGDRE